MLLYTEDQIPSELMNAVNSVISLLETNSQNIPNSQGVNLRQLKETLTNRKQVLEKIHDFTS